MAQQKKKSAKKKEPIDPFSKLTWEDLEEWAENRIVARGRSYQRSGAVRDLGAHRGRGVGRLGNGNPALCHPGAHWGKEKHRIRMHLSLLDDLQTRGGCGVGILGKHQDRAHYRPS